MTLITSVSGTSMIKLFDEADEFYAIIIRSEKNPGNLDACFPDGTVLFDNITVAKATSICDKASRIELL